jgi:hypothetical protein
MLVKLFPEMLLLREAAKNNGILRPSIRLWNFGIEI